MRVPGVGRLTAFVVVLAVATTAPSGAQTVRVQPARDSVAERALADTLERLERASWVAWQARDSAFFARFLSDDHVEVGYFGPGDKMTTVRGVGSPACVVKSYAVDGFRALRLDASTAVLTYHAAQDTRCGGAAVPSPVWATSVYVLRGGRWLNAVYQQTPDMRPPR